VKTSAEPSAGMVVETTKVVKPLPIQAESADAPNLWEYLRKLRPSDWTQHLVYVYRSIPKPSIPLGKCGELFALPDGSTVSIGDQEELELALAKFYGGGTYRIIVKKGRQWITQENLELGGTIKAITPVEFSDQSNGNGTTNPRSVSQGAPGEAAFVATRAMDALANQDRSYAETGFRAIETAANVLQRFSNNPQTASPSETDQLLKMMMLKMMEKMIDRFDAPAANSGIPLNSLAEKLFGVAVERLVNPAPSGAPVSASAELVRVLPTIGSAAVDGLREWRMGTEAQVKAIELSQRAAVQPARPATATPGPQVLPPPAPNPPVPGNAMSPPSTEFIENRIAEMLKRPISADEVADNVLNFLQTIDGPHGELGLVKQLTLQGETGLVRLFNERPALKPATANMSRLLEFIRAFLKYAQEDAQGTIPGATA